MSFIDYSLPISLRMLSIVIIIFSLSFSRGTHFSAESINYKTKLMYIYIYHEYVRKYPKLLNYRIHILL